MPVRPPARYTASMTDRAGPWIAETMHGLPCRILLPEGYRPDARYPLLVSLHGSGERGTDNVAQLRNGLDTFTSSVFRARFPCIVVAPQAPRGATFGGSWYGGPSPLQDVVMAVVRELAGRRTVDPLRIYGVGFSMGAIGLLDMLVRHRGVFAAGVPIAGDLDAAHADALLGVPLWAVVGAQDHLVPPTAVRAAVARLQAQGSPAQLLDVAHAGHDVWRAAFGHGPLWEWLFAQRRVEDSSADAR